MTEIVTSVSGFDARVLREAFEPTAEERAEIGALWARSTAENPKLFDGPVLLSRDVWFEDGLIRVRYLRTTFSSYVWRRSLGFPAGGLGNVFAAAVVVSSDGAALLGRMGRHTVNAGRLYFPCGTPDPSDIVGEAVDLEASLVRELEEETGLVAPLVTPTQERLVVATGGLVGCLRRFDCPLDARALKEAARAHISREAEPELDDVETVFSAGELDGSAPGYVHAALRRLLGPAER